MRRSDSTAAIKGLIRKQGLRCCKVQPNKKRQPLVMWRVSGQMDMAEQSERGLEVLSKLPEQGFLQSVKLVVPALAEVFAE